MDFKNNLEIKQKIQRAIIEYIDDGCEDSYTQLINLINDLKIEENPTELKDLLQLVNSLCNNHHRSPHFFKRIENIILKYKSNIQQFLSNNENLDVSNFNFRLLLLLHQEKVISINDLSPSKFTIPFNFYFSPEIKHQYPQNLRQYNKKDENIDPETFEKFRKIGENHYYICSLIRNDSIEEFISFVNKSNYPLSSVIDQSPFETNEYLINVSNISLIEYAAFFGSIQIFQFLKMNQITMTPYLWWYAIHSNSAEMIHLLEENCVPFANLTEYKQDSFLAKVEPVRISNHKIITHFIYLMSESIKCHHNDIFNYLQNNFDINKNVEQNKNKDEQNNNNNNNNNVMNNYFHNIANAGLGFMEYHLGFLSGKPPPSANDDSDDENNDENNYDFDDENNITLKDDDIESLYWSIFCSFNYIYFPEKINDELFFYYFVTYGYTTFVKYFLNEKKIDINAIVILKFTNFNEISKKKVFINNVFTLEMI